MVNSTWVKVLIFLGVFSWEARYLKHSTSTLCSIFSIIQHPYLEELLINVLKIFESPLPKNAFCQICLILTQWFLKRCWKCVKDHSWPDRCKTGQKVIRTSGELKRIYWRWNNSSLCRQVRPLNRISFQRGELQLMYNKKNGTGNDDFTLLDDEFACIRSQGIIERNRDHRKHATCLLCKHPLQQEHKNRVNYQWNLYEFVFNEIISTVNS